MPNSEPKINLRLAMPVVYEFIEACRAAFGKDMTNTQIRLGMEGAETFHASEKGIEIGTKIREPKVFLTLDKMRILDKDDPWEKQRQKKTGY